MGLDTKTEKTLEKIRRQIVQQDKRRRRMLQYFDLAIERITTGASIAELAKRHHLSEEKCADILIVPCFWRAVACSRDDAAERLLKNKIAES